MGFQRNCLSFFIAVAISPSLTLAQQPQEVTNAEPGIYNLADLFKRADTVALVKVVSGDTENYKVAIYKATIVKSFKGGAAGDIVFFGPFIGERLGWEYILFLRKVANPIAPEKSASANYGTIQYAEVFNQGYTSMMTSYECVFDGKEIAQRCDYGVRVCTDYIKIPESMPTFPPETKKRLSGADG